MKPFKPHDFEPVHHPILDAAILILYFALICLVSVMLFERCAAADCMHCGQAVVCDGDRQWAVYKKCGRPLLVTAPDRIFTRANGSITEVRAVDWIYDQGDGQFPKVITFVGDRIVSISAIKD